MFEYANGYLNGNGGNKRASCFVNSNKDDTKSDFVSGGGGRSNSRDRDRKKANRRSCDLSSAVEQGQMDLESWIYNYGKEI